MRISNRKSSEEIGMEFVLFHMDCIKILGVLFRTSSVPSDNYLPNQEVAVKILIDNGFVETYEALRLTRNGRDFLSNLEKELRR